MAPLEFVYMADWYLQKMGVRQNVEIELVTPLTGAFTKPVANNIPWRAVRAEGHQGHDQLDRGQRRADRAVIASVTGDKIPTTCS